MSLFFLAAGILTSVSILAAYQVLFLIPLCYFTFLAFKNKQINVPKSAYWLLAFTVIALISLIINFDIIPKPGKNFGRLKYYLYGLGGIFVFKVWLKEASDRSKKILCYVFMTSIIIAGVYAGQQFLRKVPRAKGLTDTMRYGYGSAMLLLSLLSAILHREKIKSWFDYRFGILAFIIGFFGMYVTYTRGGLLGFLCGIPFVLYFYRVKWGLLAGGAALIVVSTLGGYYLFGRAASTEESGSRFLINKDNRSDVIRRSQWKAAMIAVQEKPVLGWGLSNFHSQLKRIKETYDLDKKEYNDAHAHNLFLEIAAGTGIIGLILFLGWLLTWAWESFRTDGLNRAMVIPFGVALIVGSQFEVTFDANNASMIFFLYALSTANLCNKTADNH
ncbi:MAG: O-antigen ligase family protein [Bdellovibrionota bacterium]